MWQSDDVDNVHAKRIDRSGEQLLKNVRCYSKLLPPSIYIGPNAFFEANFDQMLE